MIEVCDEMSRYDDNAGYDTPARAFLAAQPEARRLWGEGFTIDRAAAANRCMPPGRGMKLPFNARWLQPGSVGRDLFEQRDYGRHISWINPPFAILARLMPFLKIQRARAAVLVPLGAHQC